MDHQVAIGFCGGEGESSVHVGDGAYGGSIEADGGERESFAADGVVDASVQFGGGLG